MEFARPDGGSGGAHVEAVRQQVHLDARVQVQILGVQTGQTGPDLSPTKSNIETNEPKTKTKKEKNVVSFLVHDRNGETKVTFSC